MSQIATFPADWEPDVLGRFAHLVPGKTPGKGEYGSAGDIKMIKFRDVLETGRVDFSNDDGGWFDSTATDRNDLVELQADTILLTNAAHSLSHLGKKIGYVEALPENVRTCFVGELTSIRTKDIEDNTRWLFYLLQTPTLRREIIKAAEGAHLVPFWLKKIPFSKPSREVRACIVETLKSADDHIRAIGEQLRKAERVKKALLQSVFVAGLPGSQSKPQLFRWGLAPDGWVESTIRGIITEPVGNGTSPEAAKAEPPGLPTLNVSSVRNGRCDPSKVSYIELPEKAAEAFAVEAGDFFVLRGNGNRDFVAIGGLLDAEPPAGLVFSDLLIRIRFDHSKALPEFMNCLWQSPHFLRRLQSYAVTGSGLWKIGQRSISRLKLAIPNTIEEQKEIADLFAAQEQLLTALENQLTAARRVKQSLLQNLLTGKIRLKS